MHCSEVTFTPTVRTFFYLLYRFGANCPDACYDLARSDNRQYNIPSS
jgi:hypothetical protein